MPTDIFDEVATEPTRDIFDEIESKPLTQTVTAPPSINMDAGKSAFGLGTETSTISGGRQLRPTEPGQLGILGKEVMQGIKEIPETLVTPLYKFGEDFGLDAQTIADAVDVLKGSAAAAGRILPGGESPGQAFVRVAGQPQREPNSIEKILAGTQKGVVESLDFFTSPLGIATLGTGALPKVAQKVIAAAFVAHMAKSMPDQYQAFLEAKYAGDTEGMSKALTGLGLTLAFITGGTKSVLKRGEPGPVTVEPRTDVINEMERRGQVENVEVQKEQWARELEAETGGKPPILPKPPLPNVPGNVFRPSVPETLPEPQRGLNVLQEIRQADARTKEQIRALFPHLTREEAQALRKQAWEEPPPPDEGGPIIPVPPTPPPVVAPPGVVVRGRATTADIIRPTASEVVAPTPVPKVERAVDVAVKPTPPAATGAPPPAKPAVPSEATPTPPPTGTDGRKPVMNMAGQVRQKRAPFAGPPSFETLHPKSQEKFNAAWEAKDAAGMDALLHLQNKGLRGEFARRTGIKLPNTAGGTKQTIKSWSEGAFDKPSASPPTPLNTGALGDVGMGGAKPGEFDKPGDYVSNMFAAIDRDRVAMGKEPMPPTNRRTWDEDNQKALALMNKDPNWIPDLLNRMEKTPRPLLSWENAGVVWQRAKWKAEYNNALQRIAAAFEDNRAEDLAAAKTDAAVFEDHLERLDRIVGRNGTGSEAGRSLNAQKMGAGDDFTLIEMTLQKRAAVGGRRLTPQESSDIQKKVTELQVLNEQFQKALNEKDTRISNSEAARAVAELKAKSAPTFDKRILAAAESIVVKMENAAKPAAQRLRERLSRMGTSPDPTIISDAAIVGSAKIARLGLDLAKFTDEMVKDFSEKIRPYIPEIWKQANAMIDSVKAPEPVKRAIRKTATLSEIKTVAGKSIADKMEAGKPNEVTFVVQRLARAFVESGVRETQALIDSVHGVIAEAIPDWTRRQTMDAISGYGDFRRLSKDEITVTLRGMKGEMQQLAKLEDMSAGRPPLKTGVERRTPTEAERKLIKAVNDAKNKFQIPIEDPETQLKSALDTLKTTLKNRITDYEDRLARKDFNPRPRRELVLDTEANRLKAQSERIKKRWQQELTADRMKNRTVWEKTLDWGTNFRRAGVLSSPMVIPKLISAGLQRLSSLPIEEAIGGVWTRIPGVSRISRMAPLEGGGSNLGAEMKGYGAAFTKGMKDAYAILKTGHSDLDVLYGKANESYTGEFELASKLLAVPGRIHGMIKAPVKRATFERAVQRLAEFYASKGLDITDEVVKTKIAVDAYKAANASIFLQDNFVASKITAFISEKTDKATGHATPGSKVWSTAGRIALPIVRVPTNIVAETMQYAGGLVSGNLRLANAFRKGVETLKPEQADLIMRELKKGSIGMALLALGYFSADSIGGYYQPGKKKKPGELDWGSVRVFGIDIPGKLLHNPLLETLQIGATIRHVADSKLKKSDTKNQGIPAGIYAAAVGVTEQVPFVREMSEIDKARNPYTSDKWWNEQLKSILIPSVIQKAAEWIDPAKKRYPKTLGQTLETGIPFMRQNVPDHPTGKAYYVP